jgi:hypothetical protein
MPCGPGSGAASAHREREGHTLSEHLDGNGALAFQHVCRMGLEGIVAKRRIGRTVGALCGLDQSQEPGRAGCNEADRMNPKHPPGPPINDDPALESDSTGQEAPIAGNERAKHETVDQGGVPTHPLSDRDMTRTSRQTHYGEVNDDSTLEKEADVMGRKAAALRTR